jgi:hypothetical protein
VGQQRRQFRLVLQRGDLGQLGVQRRDAQLLQAGFVHEAGVEVADALRVGALGRVAGGDFLDDAAQLRQGVFLQLVEGAPARLVGRDLVVCSHLPFRYSKKSSCGAHGRFDVLGGDAGRQRLAVLGRAGLAAAAPLPCLRPRGPGWRSGQASWRSRTFQVFFLHHDSLGLKKASCWLIRALTRS